MNTDYLILGGGCAGLGLAVNLINSTLKDKKIIILESRAEYVRDKTWCSWGVYPHQFQAVIKKSWSKFKFLTKNEELIFSSEIHPYQHVNSLEYYQYAKDLLAKHPNVELKMSTPVLDVIADNDYVTVKTPTESIKSQYVFDGRPPKLPENELENQKNYAIQVFLGCHVIVNKPIFDPNVAIIMDANLSVDDDIAFNYVLPFNEYEALIEPTFFLKSYAEAKSFDKNKCYQIIKEYLINQGYNDDYQICYEEYDFLPMIDFIKFNKHPHPRIYTIGTAAGLMQPGTGYAFMSIQRYNEALVKRLESKDFPEPPDTFSNFIKRIDNYSLKKTYYINNPQLYVDSIIRTWKNISGETYARFMHDCLTEQDMQVLAKNIDITLFQ
jgi:lycopene beta-cyclase